MRGSIFAILAFVTTLGVGCGSSAAERRPATAQDFRMIQRHEATIEASRTSAQRLDLSCPGLCEVLARLDGAVSTVCKIAGDVSDQDAQSRCEDARQTALGVHARNHRCECAS